MTPTLRPYQVRLRDEARDKLRSVQSVLVQAPTGSGKTVTIADMIARAAERGHSAWLTCHRRELVKQLSGALWDAGVTHGKIASGHTETKHPVQVCSIQTLVRRLDRLSPPDLLVFDEAHHATAGTWRKTAEHCSGSWIIGLTATPCRTDGSGLDDMFDEIVLGPSVEFLIEQGYLAPYRLYAPAKTVDLSGVHTRGGDWVRSEMEAALEKSQIVGDAVDHYKKYVAPGTCLVYCVSRHHARQVTRAYRAAGIDARYCAGDTPDAEREAIVTGLRERGDPPVVVSVDLFGEGLDCPGLTAVQMLRPTQSLGLYLQQVGRALRPEEGKEAAIILDHVHNSLRHGLPDDERAWTLEGRKRSRGSKGEGTPVPLHNCPECFVVFRRMLGMCPQCGWKPDPAQTREIETVDGELREIDKAKLRKLKRQEEGKAAAEGFEALVALAVERGYRFGWASYRWAARKQGNPKQYFGEERKLRRSR